MKYDKYRNKMKKLHKTQNFVLKYKILILAVAGILLALSASYLFTAGVVTNVELPTTFTYGEEIEVKGNALFRDVTYQYALVVEGEEPVWVDEQPTMPGNYQVRAAATKLVGGVSYSSPAPFIIGPKEVEVNVVAGYVEFGDKPTITGNLIEGDYFYYADFEYEDYGSKSTLASVIEESIVVHNEKGEDVTKAYKFVNKSANITFVSEVIYIKIPSKEKIYDGTPLTSNEYENSALIDGHRLELSTDATITEVGTIDNKIDKIAIYSNETNVIENYLINYEIGTLTVHKRPITIVTDSSSKIYDGASMTNLDFWLKEESLPLVEGHTAKVVKNSSVTEVGTVQNVLEIRIYDLENNDVTHNYDISYQYGDLSVTQLDIKIETSSEVKMYDGEPLKSEKWNLVTGYSLIEGHSTKLVSSPSITELGFIDNELVIKVVDSEGNDVSKNYNIQYEYGVLFVNERDLKITTSSKKEEYTSEELISLDYEVEGFAGGFEIKIIENSSITYVGKCENKLKLAIYDGETDISEKFNFTYIYGELEVIPKKIKIKTYDYSRPYNGEELTYLEAIKDDINYHIVNYDLPEGEELEVISYASIVDVGEQVNEVMFKIQKGEEDYSKYYDISYDYGTLVVIPRNVTVDIVDKTKVYDGTPLTSTDWKYSTDTEFKLVEGESLDLINLGTITNVGEVDNINDAHTILRAGVNINSNYNLVVNKGTLTITLREIKVQTYDYVREYNGLDLTYLDAINADTNNTFDIIEGSLAIIDGVSQTIEVEQFASILNVGNIKNEVTFIIKFGEDDVTSNYDISYDYGTLEVIPRNVTVDIVDKTKVYDGTPLTSTDWKYSTDTEFKLVEGESLDLINLGTITNVGEVDNINDAHTILRAGVNINSNYNLVVNKGTLTITLREIKVQTYDYVREYNGLDLTYLDAINADTNNTFDIIEGSLAIIDGVSQTIEVEQFASILNVGNIKNEVTFIIKFGEDDVTSNYDISYDYGTLEIIKRPITIQADYATKMYDGTALTSTDVILFESPNEVVSGEVLTITTSGSIVDFGTVFNPITSHSIVKANGDDSYDNYDVTYNHEGVLEITKRPITIQADYATKMYDGTALTSTAVILFESPNEVVSGEVLTITTSGSIVDAGMVFNPITSHAIVKANGDDSYDNYDVTYNHEGVLEITKRPITIQADYATKIYDGTALTSTAVILFESPNEVVSGEVLTITTSGLIVDAGTAFNPITSHAIVKADGTNSYNNYDVTYNHEGILEITPRHLSIYIVDKEEQYFGDYLTSIDWKYIDDAYSDYIKDPHVLVEGEVLTLSTTGKVKYVIEGQTYQTVDNEYESHIVAKANGDDSYVNYVLDVVDKGTLTIKQRDVEITTYSSEKVYDGEVIDYTYTYNDPTNLEHQAYTLINKVEDEVDSIASYENFVDVVYDEEGNVTYKLNKIYLSIKEDGEDVTYNYKFDEHFGQLKITKLSIKIQADYATKMYDGTALTSTAVILFESPNEVVSGEVLTIITSGSIVDFGTVFNPITSHSIVKANGDDSTDNYDVTYNHEGVLEITKRPITIKATDVTKVYDGKVFTSDLVEEAPGSLLIVDGEILTITTTGSIVDAGIAFNPITSHAIVKADGTNSYNNYDVTYNHEGILEITPRHLSIYIVDKEEQYFGDYLTSIDWKYIDDVYTDYSKDPHVLVEGEVLTLTTTGKVKYVIDGQTYQTVDNEYESHIVAKANGDDSYVNYVLDVVDKGTLTIKQRDVEITTYSGEKVYDGEVIDYTYTYNDPTNLEHQAYTLINKVEDEVDCISSYKTFIDVAYDNIGNVTYKLNEIYLSITEDETDVTYNYNFIEHFGQLTINKRPIKVVTYDATKVYDGTPLLYSDAVSPITNNSFDIKEGTLVTGENIYIKNHRKDVIDVRYDGDTIVGYDNEITVMILKADGDSTSNYDIDYSEKGTLTITQREITIETFSYSRQYNGEYLTYLEALNMFGECYKLEGSLASSDERLNVVEGYAQILYKGSTENVVEFDVYRGTEIEPITKNYKINYKYGTLEIYPRNIKVYLVDDSKIYDGQPLTSNAWMPADDTENLIVKNDKLDIVADGSIIYVDHNELKNNKYVSHKFTNEKGEDISSSYSLECLPGTLTITPRPVNIIIEDDEKYYDNIALTSDAWKYADTSLKLVNNDRITDVLELTMSGSITDVIWNGDFEDSIINEVISYKIYNEEMVNLVNNYDFEFTPGKLKILAIHISIIIEDKEKQYFGEYFTSNDWKYDETAYMNDMSEDPHKVLNGEVLTIETLGKVKYVVYGETYQTVDNEYSGNFEAVKSNGIDVSTMNYVIDVARTGTLTITQRDVEITTYSGEKVYDGEAIDYTYTYNDSINTKHQAYTLINKVEDEVDSIASYESFIDVVYDEEGNVTYKLNKIYLSIKEDGVEVTYNYKFDEHFGQLKITKRPIKVITNNGEKTYDGTPLLYSDAVDLNGNSYNVINVVSGEAISVIDWNRSAIDVLYEDGLIIGYENWITISIQNAHGSISTANYDIDYSQKGKLTINRRKIEITTLSGNKIYDGTPLMYSDILGSDGKPYKVTNSSIVEGETVDIVDYNSTAIDVLLNGDEIIGYENYIKIVINKANGVDSSLNYDVNYVNGTLTINKRPIKIQADYATKVYDGTPLTSNNVVVMQDSPYDIVIGEILTITTTGSIIDFGTKTNPIKSHDIVKADGTNSYNNYDVTYDHEGVLEITKRPIIIQADYATKVYDGTPLTSNNVVVTQDSPYDIVIGEILTITTTGSIIDFGTETNPIKSHDIVKADGTNSYNNYDVTYNHEGILEITKLEVNVIVQDSREYDGTEFSSNNWIYQDFSNFIVEGEKLEFVTTGKITNVGQIINSVESYTILKSNGDNSKNNYDLNYIEGNLEITPRDIYINTGSDVKAYDGTPLTNSEWEYADENKKLVLDHVLVVDKPLISITELGSIENTNTYKVYDTNSVDVSYNYNIIISIPGTLEIRKRVITINVISKTKAYDGTPLTSSEYEHSLSDDGVLSSHSLNIEFIGSITEVGKCDNDFNYELVDKKTLEDVGKYYDVIINSGTLTVTSYEIYIFTGSAEKEYDGLPLTNSEIYILDDKSKDIILISNNIFLLAENQSFFHISMRAIGSITKPGKIINSVYGEIIDENGESVTNNFYFNPEFYGTLTVKAEGSGGSGSGSGGGTIPNPGGSGGSGGGAGGPLDLSGSLDGALGEGFKQNFMKPNMIVISDTSGMVYLKMKSFGDYTGKGWAEANAYTQLIDEELSAQYLTALALEQTNVKQSLISIKSEYNEYVLPYYALAKDSIVQKSDTYISGSPADEYGFVYYNWDYTSGVKVSSEYSIYEEQYYQFVCDQYLSVDSTTKQYMQNIINTEGFNINDPELINKVAQYIKNSAVYNKKYDKELDNSSNVAVDFLSTYKEGVCRHYSTAATLLFRTLGLPARYTVGYATHADKNVPAKIYEGHAWVEVYIQGLGWIKVEVTGSSADDEGLDGSVNTIDQNNKFEVKLTPLRYPTYYNGEEQFLPSDWYYISTLPEGYRYDIKYVELLGSGTLIGEYETSIGDYEIYVYNENGEDVTEYVEFVLGTSTMVISPAKLIIESDSESKEYDGQELKNENLTINGLIKGHEVVSSGFASITNVGKISNDFEVIVIDSEGNDVTDQYELVLKKGELEVKPAPIKIVTASNYWDYDGQYHSDRNYEITEGALLPGHSIEIIGDTFIINPGEIENVLIIRIVDENGNILYAEDIENSMYAVDLEYGILKIGCVLNIETEAESKYFDGLELINHNYTFDVDGKNELPSGHFMKVTFKNSLICVGQVLNEIDITITDKDGNDLTSNYKINKLEGMLEIKPLKVKVVIGSLNLVYTGKVMDKRLASGKVTGLEGLAIAYESDIKYTIKDYVNASQMYTVGKQTQYVPYLDAIYVKNGDFKVYGYLNNGEELVDIYENLDVTYVNGSLTIKKKSITVTSASDMKQYDETPLENKTYTLSGKLASGHSIEVVITGSVIIGEKKNTIKSIKIYDELGNDVTFNYSIKKIEGKLEVIQ